jgi:sugar phosphate isomerase/epimerase
VGDGELPIAKLYAALKSIGYDGWFTLEWEKRWHPEIEEPEVAIPAFAKFIRALTAND